MNRINQQAMPHVLLVASPHSYRIAAYIKAALELGIRITVASEGEHSLINEVANGLHIDLSDRISRLKLIEEAKKSGISGVIATDDVVVELAGDVARALHLPANSALALQCARRKDIARKTQKEAGIEMPDFQILNLASDDFLQDIRIRFPCVVKPLSLSGSRGVIRVNNLSELKVACKRISAIIADQKDHYERSHVLLESYIDGFEIAYEGLLDNGHLNMLTIFDKPDPLEGPYFEETYYISPTGLSSQVQQQITHKLQFICEAYGMREGPVHAELRLNNEGIHLIELAARTIGGDCARLLSFGTGASLEEWVLKQAARLPLKLVRPEVAAGVLMIPNEQRGLLRRVEGILAAQSVTGIEDLSINVRQGYELVPLPEGMSYLGFIFAKAETPKQVEAALRKAFGYLKVITAPVLAKGKWL